MFWFIFKPCHTLEEDIRLVEAQIGKSLIKEIIDLQLLCFFRVLAVLLLSSVSLDVVPKNMSITK